MSIRICHVDGEDCWFADIDDQGCQGRFAVYVMGESGGDDLTYGAAVSA
ncbi:hypothetical protein [Nonomuraea endophytica]